MTGLPSFISGLPSGPSCGTPFRRKYFCASTSVATLDHVDGTVTPSRRKTTVPSGLRISEVRGSKRTPSYGSRPATVKRREIFMERPRWARPRPTAEGSPSKTPALEGAATREPARLSCATTTYRGRVPSYPKGRYGGREKVRPRSKTGHRANLATGGDSLGASRGRRPTSRLPPDRLLQRGLERREVVGGVAVPDHLPRAADEERRRVPRDLEPLRERPVAVMEHREPHLPRAVALLERLQRSREAELDL